MNCIVSASAGVARLTKNFAVLVSVIDVPAPNKKRLRPLKGRERASAVPPSFPAVCHRFTLTHNLPVYPAMAEHLYACLITGDNPGGTYTYAFAHFSAQLRKDFQRCLPPGSHRPGLATGNLSYTRFRLRC